MIPFYESPEKPRYHAIAWDNSAIWQIIGNDCKRYSDYEPGLVKYDAASGRQPMFVAWADAFRIGSATDIAEMIHMLNP